MANSVAAMASEPQAHAVRVRSTQSDRLFYIIAASLMVIFTAGGFRNFYLHGKAPWGDMTSQILPLIVVHGLAMTSWVVFFLIQSILIQSGNRRLHMVIGPAGGVLALAIVILGTVVAPLSVRFRPEIYLPFGGPRPFLATMFAEMILFGAFVGIALAYRRRPEIHRPMMLVATLAILSGSLGRFPYVEDLAARPPLYAWWPPLLFGGLLFLLQWAMSRAANRWYFLGYAGIVIGALLSVAVGNTAVWNQIAAAFVP
jgi:hypothetical protein